MPEGGYACPSQYEVLAEVTLAPARASSAGERRRLYKGTTGPENGIERDAFRTPTELPSCSRRFPSSRCNNRKPISLDRW